MGRGRGKGLIILKILTLDLATKSGWSLCENGKFLSSGVENFAVHRGESAGMLFVRFRGFLSEMLSVTQPDLVGYEDPLYMGRSNAAARRILIGMATHTESMCIEKGVEFTAIHGATLKVYILGSVGLKGRSKKLMAEAAALLWPEHVFIDDNEIDACALCDYLSFLYTSGEQEPRCHLTFLEDVQRKR